ncbi:hypothetical protein P879_02042 [Paragonimus westermani]|uniref:Uncharacterized protein n=1 Tax=Paragonimus westermani TaxID=34504 RepID=A0A8T0DUB6_9TREM|nr:hypothetical protein P879_02042 [Paragonimus westermani]
MRTLSVSHTAGIKFQPTMTVSIRATLCVLLGLSTIQAYPQQNTTTNQAVSGSRSRSKIEIITGFLISGMSSLSREELVESMEMLRPVFEFVDIADLIDASLSPLSSSELSTLGYGLSKELVNKRFGERVSSYLSGFTGRQFVKQIEPLLSILSADSLTTILKLVLPLFARPDSHVVTESSVPESSESVPDVSDKDQFVEPEQTTSQTTTWTDTTLSGKDPLNTTVELDTPVQLTPCLKHILRITILGKIASQWEYSHLISTPFEIASLRRHPKDRDNVIVSVRQPRRRCVDMNVRVSRGRGGAMICNILRVHDSVNQHACGGSWIKDH